MKDYIQIAKKIIERHNLQTYIDVLIDYWSANPPTLGHGFSHVLKVAVESYEIAELNNYDHPEYLFIGGLFHDVYRPAETGDGNEDQTKGADITLGLFNKHNIPDEISNLVINAIKSHDAWRSETNPPLFDLYLSLGDKSSHDNVVAYGYVWSVNKFQILKTGEPKFTNHLVPLYAFFKYQSRAWDIFMKFQVKGVERGIESYIKVDKSIMDNYLNDKTGENFLEYVEQIAENCRKEEKKFVAAFRSKDIDKLMINFY